MVNGRVKKLTKGQLRERIKELQKELEEKINLAEERLNQLKYLQADFENYRKNFEKEKERIIDLANENLITELLVIVDDFDRALRLIENEKNKEGLIMLHKNFLRILENYGLKKIEALGKKFDPYYHEVILKEKSEKEDGTVLDEIQHGYTLKTKVVRHSKVKISENMDGGDKDG